MTGRPHPQAGFTLLEILIALMVFSLVLLVLQQGFQTATMLFERQHGLLASQAELGAVDRLLRGLVTRADPGAGREGPLFVGQAHGLVLRGALPLALNDRPGAQADIRLSVDAHHRLLLAWHPYRHVIEPPAPARQQMLLTNVADLDCTYFSNGHWNTTWDADHLPTLVRLRIRFPDGDPRHWPDIVASPQLDPMPQ
ncbi:prepilin-type N-terminal cleavage/methylation domain-containing protein [Gluconacetobacter takamatsuzukensis]|uniref:Prepilin-type N-terminal cleavage/methylation domain-containing protein n=1 Tax=Gluconacetobacter takamatsuzukensis TaxID=1286190 RepID=A0A7W4KE60_9PROT|nr:prepilin-type N-terminal cleavage/methylation domain-containing protein [Gluconacetobacter takamatsuzukensis]MBB2205318.1 prepilin-type N-terminal cleavage/methylation domain-containing protein [Gluconacetobacter takamatsuzukensis]